MAITGQCFRSTIGGYSSSVARTPCPKSPCKRRRVPLSSLPRLHSVRELEKFKVNSQELKKKNHSRCQDAIFPSYPQNLIFPPLTLVFILGFGLVEHVVVVDPKVLVESIDAFALFTEGTVFSRLVGGNRVFYRAKVRYRVWVAGKELVCVQGWIQAFSFSLLGGCVLCGCL